MEVTTDTAEVVLMPPVLAEHDKSEWRNSDRLKYTLAILRNNLGLSHEMMRSMMFHLKAAADGGVPLDVLEDEARTAIYYSEYRQRIEAFADAYGSLHDPEEYEFHTDYERSWRIETVLQFRNSTLRNGESIPVHRVVSIIDLLLEVI